MNESLYDLTVAALPPQLAADYIATDKLIDQLLEMHGRASKAGDTDMMLMFSIEMGHAFGMLAAYHDLARTTFEPSPTDIVHHDEEGWWFWEETWAHRQGPFRTETLAKKALHTYVRALLQPRV